MVSENESCRTLSLYFFSPYRRKSINRNLSFEALCGYISENVLHPGSLKSTKLHGDYCMRGTSQFPHVRSNEKKTPKKVCIAYKRF